MGRTAGRDPEQTRSALLDAAGQLVHERGISATLDDVARRAGVSKGGLLYHFASKQELLLAMAHDWLERFRMAVLAAVDPDDDAPGRLVRAYVRVSIDGALDAAATRDALVVIAHLSTVDAVTDLARADALRWQQDLRADGLPEDVLLLVLAAADGASAQPVWGMEPAPEELERLRKQLLALTVLDR
ncbi:TetR/AcrR family transcriptional regulator [Promicromonospora sp. NPDC023987]|uniref:TetR/AcrR family transcriptional regulator n=1 Tax=Promicromonospora sp. NPDC023987 TaxID=3155360 RepID=UPI0033C5341D